MKTTLDLPDELLTEAKVLAARRKITLKALVEAALRRELRPLPEVENPDPQKFDVDSLGFLVLKRRPGETITLQQIQAIEDEMEEEEFRRAIQPRRS